MKTQQRTLDAQGDIEKKKKHMCKVAPPFVVHFFLSLHPLSLSSLLSRRGQRRVTLALDPQKFGCRITSCRPYHSILRALESPFRGRNEEKSDSNFWDRGSSVCVFLRGGGVDKLKKKGRAFFFSLSLHTINTIPTHFFFFSPSRDPRSPSPLRKSLCISLRRSLNVIVVSDYRFLYRKSFFFVPRPMALHAAASAVPVEAAAAAIFRRFDADGDGRLNRVRGSVSVAEIGPRTKRNLVLFFFFVVVIVVPSQSKGKNK